MEDILTRTFQEASTSVATPGAPGAGPMQSQPQTPVPVPVSVPLPRAADTSGGGGTTTTDALLALVHFLLAAHGATAATPEGLRHALATLTPPASLDAAANAMGTIMALQPAKLVAVLGPPGGADGSSSQDSPRALLQQLLHRAVTDNGNAVARVSLQAVLLRWLQKALAQGNDPHTASVLASAAYNLDVIHNLTSNGGGSGTGASGPSTALVPARKQADQGNTVSKKTLTIVAVIAAILGVAVIVLAALMFTRGKKGSSPSSFSPDTPSASAGGVAGYGGRYGQVYRPSGREAFGPSSPPLQAHSAFHQPTFAPL
jgi:hypothetical protein